MDAWNLQKNYKYQATCIKLLYNADKSHKKYSINFSSFMFCKMIQSALIMHL